jgi:hypothetical protein
MVSFLLYATVSVERVYANSSIPPHLLRHLTVLAQALLGLRPVTGHKAINSVCSCPE